MHIVPVFLSPTNSFYLFLVFARHSLAGADWKIACVDDLRFAMKIWTNSQMSKWIIPSRLRAQSAISDHTSTWRQSIASFGINGIHVIFLFQEWAKLNELRTCSVGFGSAERSLCSCRPHFIDIQLTRAILFCLLLFYQLEMNGHRCEILKKVHTKCECSDTCHARSTQCQHGIAHVQPDKK